MSFSLRALRRPSSTIRLLFLCSSTSSILLRTSINNIKNRCALSTSPFTSARRRIPFSTAATTSCMERGALEGASDVRKLVSAIHASPNAGVLYTTGGASSAASALLSVPGASSTVLDAAVPYSRTATMELIGDAEVKSFASQEAALALANSAFRRAMYIGKDEMNLVGIGAACALATSRARRGDDRAHVAVVTNMGFKTYAIYFAASTSHSADDRNEQGDRRLRQERAASRLALHALSSISSDTYAGTERISIAPEFVKAALIADDEYEESSVQNSPDLLDAVLSEKIPYAEVSNFGKSPLVWTPGETQVGVILPGSFNPVHIGHRHLLQAGVNFLRSQDSATTVVGAYELSVRNADKPALSPDVVRRRLLEFKTSERVIVANAPLFTDKAALYPEGTMFVLGHDTALRLVMPKYYGGVEEMIRAFVKIAMKGGRFLVGARYDSETKKVKTLDDIDVPYVLKDLFIPIPVEQFREDISSTEIRASRRNASLDRK